MHDIHSFGAYVNENADCRHGHTAFTRCDCVRQKQVYPMGVYVSVCARVRVFFCAYSPSNSINIIIRSFWGTTFVVAVLFLVIIPA